MPQFANSLADLIEVFASADCAAAGINPVVINGGMSSEKSLSIVAYAPFTALLARRRDLHGILRADFRRIVDVILAD
ncbi:hypothetical protein [Paraburkholderia sediminicola]|uniref:hypothetical protein n=1 Tax=Paraburkholderia sediminicola TaxID=458836 RepID=UPI0038B706FE